MLYIHKRNNFKYFQTAPPWGLGGWGVSQRNQNNQMAKQNRFQRLTHQASQEVGFGNTTSINQRLMNPDGSYNYTRVGLPWYESFNIFHFFITAPLSHFFVVVILWYTSMNLVFTGLYYMTGVQHLTGMVYKNEFDRFFEVYFFSAQTLTTVGYRRIRVYLKLRVQPPNRIRFG